MTNLVSLAELAGFPPQVPLMTDTIHTLGWVLLVSLVAGPGLALAGSVLRDVLAKASAPKGGASARRRSAQLCSSSAA